MKLLGRIAPLFVYIIAAKCTLNPFNMVDLSKYLNSIFLEEQSQPKPWPHNIFDPQYFQRDTYNPEHGGFGNPYFRDQENPIGINNFNPDGTSSPYYNRPYNHVRLNTHFRDHTTADQPVIDNVNRFNNDNSIPVYGYRLEEKTKNVGDSEMFPNAKREGKDFTVKKSKELKDGGNNSNENAHDETDSSGSPAEIYNQKEFILRTNQDSIKQDVYSNVIPFQNIPNVNRNIVVMPLTNYNGMPTTNQNLQIISNDLRTGLPVLNINGMLYNYVNTPSAIVSTGAQSLGQVIPFDQINSYANNINQLQANNNAPHLILVNRNGQMEAQSGAIFINGVSAGVMNGGQYVPYAAPNQGVQNILYPLESTVKTNIPGSNRDPRIYGNSQDNLVIPKSGLSSNPIVMASADIPYQNTVSGIEDQNLLENLKNGVNENIIIDILMQYILHSLDRQPEGIEINNVENLQASATDEHPKGPQSDIILNSKNDWLLRYILQNTLPTENIELKTHGNANEKNSDSNNSPKYMLLKPVIGPTEMLPESIRKSENKPIQDIDNKYFTSYDDKNFLKKVLKGHKDLAGIENEQHSDDSSDTNLEISSDQRPTEGYEDKQNADNNYTNQLVSLETTRLSDSVSESNFGKYEITSTVDPERAVKDAEVITNSTVASSDGQ